MLKVDSVGMIFECVDAVGNESVTQSQIAAVYTPMAATLSTMSTTTLPAGMHGGGGGGDEMQLCYPPALPPRQFLSVMPEPNHLFSFSLDEPAGSTEFQDVSPMGYEATCSLGSCPSATGAFLRFDGQNDFATFGNPPQLNYVGEIVALEAWIIPRATDGIRNILAHGYQLEGPRSEVYLRIHDGNYEAGVWWFGVGHQIATGVRPEDLDNWVHLVGPI